MNEKNPTLCIVAGPNGSGKTSTTVQLLHNEWAENSLYINPDNIAQEQYGDWNSPVAVLKAAELATKMRYECLRKRQDFVFETVFSSDEKLAFVEEAKKAGFFIRIFFVCTNNPEINVRRITQRYLNGGHEVPISKIISRYYKSLDVLGEVKFYYDRPIALSANPIIKLNIENENLTVKEVVPTISEENGDWVLAADFENIPLISEKGYTIIIPEGTIVSKEGDVVVAISFSPYAAETVNISKVCAKKGIKQISITDSQISPLLAFSDIAFVIKEAQVLGFRSQCSTMTLVQTLAIVLGLEKEKDKNTK